MTRFARAKGSKSSNERVPEQATPWSEMKAELLNKDKEREENEKREKVFQQRNASYQQFLQEREEENKNVIWANFGNDNNHENNNKKKCKLNHDGKDDTVVTKVTKRDEINSEELNNKNKNSVKRKVAIHSNSSANIDFKNLSEDQHKLINKKGKCTNTSINKKEKPIELKESHATLTGENSGKINKSKKNKNSIKQSKDQNLKQKKKKKNQDKSDLNNVEVVVEKGSESQSEKEDEKSEKDLLKMKKKKERKLRQIEKKKQYKLAQKELQASSEPPSTELNGGEKSFQAKSFQRNQNKFPRNNNFSKTNANKRKEKRQNNSNIDYRRKKTACEILYINGKTVDVKYIDGFPVKKEDAERITKLRREMISKGLPRSEIDFALKLERRKAEKALARDKKNVCFNCRKSGHMLSECPELNKDQVAESAGTGICFKCGSTEHTHFECKVERGDNYKFAQCFICNQQGHIARQCPDNQRGLYPKGGSCKVCGDVTHLKKDCPKYQAQQSQIQSSLSISTIDNDNPDIMGSNRNENRYNSVHKRPNKIIKF